MSFACHKLISIKEHSLKGVGELFVSSPVDRKLLAVAFPAIGGYLGLVCFDVIDIFWIGKLGTDALAGVASAGFIVWTVVAGMQVTLAGCSSLIAKFYGARDIKSAHETIVESFWASVLLGILAVAFLLPCIKHMFSLMGLSDRAVQFGAEYFRIIVLGFPVTYLNFLSAHIFNAYGDTLPSTKIMAVALILNIILDPILMFGMLGFPELGVAGAAYATVSCQAVALIWRAVIARRKNYMGEYLSFFTFHFRHIGQILKIGIPVAVTGVIWSAVYPLLARLITPFGMPALSAVGICHRLESFPYFFALGFNIALVSLIGQAKGRNDTDEIRHLVRRGIFLVTVFMLPFVLAFVAFPAMLIKLLNDDPLILGHGIRYLYIIGLFELFMAWEVAFSGIFTGYGKTHPILWISIPFTLARIPLGWLLAFPLAMDASGIWWAISLSSLAKGAGSALLYKFLMLPELSLQSLADSPSKTC